MPSFADRPPAHPSNSRPGARVATAPPKRKGVVKKPKRAGHDPTHAKTTAARHTLGGRK